MFFIKLPFLNLLRHYGRTCLSLVSIILGVLVIILGRGAISGLRESVIRGEIDGMTGHVSVLPADYPTSGLLHPVDGLYRVTAETEGWLNEHAVAWTRRLFFAPRLVYGIDAMRVRAIAFDPDTDANVFPRRDWRVEGRIPESAADGVLLSRGIARTLAVKPGDMVVLETRTVAGAINALQMPVAGIVSTGNPAIDSIILFLPLSAGEDLVRTDGAISHISLLLGRRTDAVAAAERLQEILGETVQTTTWEMEAAPGLEAQDLRQRFLDILVVALLVMAAAGIANTVLMAAYERIREIGTLRALGLTRRGVAGLFMAEGFVMGLIGSVIGATLGAWLTLKYSIEGIDMTGLVEEIGSGEMFQDIPFSSMLYFAFSYRTILLAIVVGMIVATISSLYPAMLAARKEPADAVRS